MSDPTKRVAQWAAKYKTDRIKATLDDLRPDMLRRYQEAVAELYAMEIKTKETLNAQGVHTILYIPYLNYSRQLYKLSRKRNISGDSMKMAAQVLLEKWRLRGLDPDVLAAIRWEVFSIPAP